MNLAAIVANPTKVGDADEARRVLAEACERNGWPAPLWLDTTEEDPGGGQARQALEKGATLVCALGGDGTVRAVAEVLAGGDVPLALLPAGTGNLLARALELSLGSLDEAMGVALTGRTARIDVGVLRVDGAAADRVFLVMAGMGMDAEIMDTTDERLKSAVGWPAYVVAGLRAVRGSGFGVRVQADQGATVRRVARVVVVGNSGKLRGGVDLMPDAVLDDGLLDVAVIAPRGPIGWIRTMATVLASGRGHSQLERRQAPAFRVSADRPTATQLDGDPVGEHRRIECRVRPGALLVRVSTEPAGSGGDPS